MILIAHRGNVNGPQSDRENHPDHIRKALGQGYHAEIDLWYQDKKWVLGHDEPQYETSLTFLSQMNLWIHCKDYATLQKMVPDRNLFNFFYHTDEDYVLTSSGWIWAYPGMPGGKNTICVMPEWNDQEVEGFAGVCSDYVGRYR